ncbi:arginase family protein [Actinoallomurus spadix]|uniref:Arginase family protein n=1 Tax=Actinoallomurus spadix TaxID=79912 RepID=A0ABP3FTR4_9ACTN|nr:arginase family protein [Actinoallomurus spadix]MCO5985411.1 arginase family protein [Actinoallomurus spadix]
MTSVQRSIAVLDAPSNLGLRPPREGHQPGVRGLAAALRGHGLVDRLGAADAGRVEPPPYSFDGDPVTGYRNGPAIAEFSVRLADRVGDLLDAGRFPLVLGGDCGIALGPALALRRRGAYGFVYLDGHDDYSPLLDPASRHGRFTAGGTALALITGHGPAALTGIEGLGPYIAEEHAVHIGAQYEPEDLELFDIERFRTSPIHRYPIEYVRAHGASAAAEAARRDLAAAPVEGHWIHIDADVLDRSVMPAVDSPNPDGLSVPEFTEVLAILLADPRVAGMHVGIYDPELDPSGEAGRALAGALVSALIR